MPSDDTVYAIKIALVSEQLKQARHELAQRAEATDALVVAAGNMRHSCGAEPGPVCEDCVNFEVCETYDVHCSAEGYDNDSELFGGSYYRDKDECRSTALLEDLLEHFEGVEGVCDIIRELAKENELEVE